MVSEGAQAGDANSYGRSPVVLHLRQSRPSDCIRTRDCRDGGNRAAVRTRPARDVAVRGGRRSPRAAEPAPSQPDDGTRTDVYAFGAAAFLGANSQTLNRPVVGMAATASGNGYWLAASDGGIFAFGDSALLRFDRWPHVEPAHRRDGGVTDR